MLYETGRCLLCFALYERASSNNWGACYLRHSDALSIMWILMLVSSHTASSATWEREYHIWSISSCPGQVRHEDPHQGDISLEILWRQIREGMGATAGKISLSFSFSSEVMRVSEVSQPSYHPHFQALPSGSQQQTVKGGISRWMRDWVHSCLLTSSCCISMKDTFLMCKHSGYYLQLTFSFCSSRCRGSAGAVRACRDCGDDV